MTGLVCLNWSNLIFLLYYIYIIFQDFRECIIKKGTGRGVYEEIRSWYAYLRLKYDDRLAESRAHFSSFFNSRVPIRIHHLSVLGMHLE